MIYRCFNISQQMFCRLLSSLSTNEFGLEAAVTVCSVAVHTTQSIVDAAAIT